MAKYYILFVILNTLDLIGSYLLIGPDQEYNPLCTYIWRTYGFEALVVFKVLDTIMPIAIISCYYKVQPKRAKCVMILANILVSIPVIMLTYLWSL